VKVSHLKEKSQSSLARLLELKFPFSIELATRTNTREFLQKYFPTFKYFWRNPRDKSSIWCLKQSCPVVNYFPFITLDFHQVSTWFCSQQHDWMGNYWGSGMCKIGLGNSISQHHGLNQWYIQRYLKSQPRAVGCDPSSPRIVLVRIRRLQTVHPRILGPVTCSVENTKLLKVRL